LRTQVAAAGEEALMLFAADKVSKLRELSLTAALPAARTRGAKQVRDRRLAHYRGCLRLLRERLPDSPLVVLLETELARVCVAAGPARAPARGLRRRERAPAAHKPLRSSPAGSSAAGA
jgi:hypothetical protein